MYYFGKEEAEKFGDLVRRELQGMYVSKQMDKANCPGGLRFEADMLKLDMWDLLACLEGLLPSGHVVAVDDSTYYIKG